MPRTIPARRQTGQRIGACSPSPAPRAGHHTGETPGIDARRFLELAERAGTPGTERQAAEARQ